MIARVLLGAGALQAALFLWYLLRGNYALPAFDLLDILAALLQGVGWVWLFQPHNEHLLVLPKLWFAFDLAVLRGSLLAHALLCFAIWTAAFLALVPVLMRAAGEERDLALAGIGLLAVLWFRTFTLEPFVIALGIGFVAMLGPAVCAMILALRFGTGRRPTGGAGRLLAVLLLGLCAVGSLANGILALPVAALLAWRRDRPGPALVIFAAGLACALGYVLTRSGAGGGGSLGGMLSFLIAFFAAPWFKVVAMPAIVLSVATILLLLALAPLALIARETPARLAGGLALFALAGAALVAYGRQGGGTGGALAGRYGLFVVLGHTSILLALVQGLRWTSPAIRGGAFALLGLGAVVLLAEQVVIGQRYAARADAVAALRATLGQPAPPAGPFALIHPAPAHALDVLKRLRAEGFYGLR